MLAAGVPSLILGLLSFLARNAFGDIRQSLDKVSVKIDNLSEAVGGHGNRLVALETELKSIERRLASLEESGR
jgi:hypothetical protein